MITKSKMVLVAAAAAVMGFASPALAAWPEINPNFGYPVEQAVSHVTSRTNHARALQSYGYVPPQGAMSTDSPALSGAGTTGYNWSLRQF